MLYENIYDPTSTLSATRESFRFNGIYAPIVKQTDTATDRTQFLLNSIASTVVGGINNVGGANALSASSFSPISDLQRNYFGV